MLTIQVEKALLYNHDVVSQLVPTHVHVGGNVRVTEVCGAV